MRSRFLYASLIFGLLVYLGCSGSDGSGPAGPGLDARSGLNATGPCSDVTPLAWGASVTDDRVDASCPESELGDAGDMLGPSDGVFASLGGDSGSSVILGLEVDVFDGPDNDLVIYEVADGGPGDDYDVYVSESANSGFTKVAEVRMEGVYCIDLRDMGIERASFVKLTQASNVPVPLDTTVTFDTTMVDTGTVIDTMTVITPDCDDDRGADIDAVGVLSDCPDFESACDLVGAEVDRIWPPDGDYRNHGEYVSGVAHVTKDVMRHFELARCLGEDELDDVHGCVVSKRARSNVGKKNR